MREEYKKYTKTMEKVLSLLRRCFSVPNCLFHNVEYDITIMYRSYAAEEADKIFITVKDIDFEFSSFNNVVNFLVAYIGG